MKLKKYLLFLFIPVLLVGCVEKEIIDDVNIEMGLGFDLKGEKQIEGTILIPVFNPDKKIGNFTFNDTASSTRDLLQEIQRKSAQPIVTGSLAISVFGEDMAKHGIIELIDSFERDPAIGARVYLVVGEGSAKEILSGNYGNRGNAVHLTDLLTHNTETLNLPRTNLHDFLSDFYQKGIDPYLPILKKNNDVIDITGIALFKDEKMVDKIPADKMFYFKLLTDKISEGAFKGAIGKDEIAIKDIHSKHKFKLTKRNPHSITIEIKVKGVIREYTGKMITPAIITKIEKDLEESVNKECSTLIASFQEQGIDPLGFGEFLRSKTRGFDFKKWEDDYKNMTVHIKADAKITELGIIE